jgi:predicted dehydrogenase
MTEKIKVGVIGLGMIGPAHIEAIRRLGNAEVVAVATTTDARKKADALGVEYAFDNWRDMLDMEGLQAVHICTPNDLHFEMAKTALEKGLHVVCDKPLAMTVKEGEELTAIAEKAKGVSAIHFNIRYYPMVRQVKAMIGAGELGELFAVNGSYLQDWLQLETDYSWRLEPEKTGDSRAVADIGSHWCDAVEYMTGLNISRVCADFATFYPTRKKPSKPVASYAGMLLKPEDYTDVPINTEDYASMLFHMGSKVHGNLTVNQACAGRKNRMYFEICGTKGSVAFDSERPNELWVGKRECANGLLIRDPSLVYPEVRSIITFPGGHCEGFPDTSKQLFREFYDYIANDGKAKGLPVTFPTFKDGLRELQLCSAIVSSSRSEAWTEV